MVRSTGSLEHLEQWSGTQIEVLSSLELRRDPHSAQRLELDGPAVARLTVRRWVDDEPFAVTDIVLPPDVGAQLVAEDRLPSGREPGTVIAAVDDDDPRPGRSPNINSRFNRDVVVIRISASAKNGGL